MDRCTALSASYGQKEYLMMFYFSSFGLLHPCYRIPSLNPFLIRWFQMRLHNSEVRNKRDPLLRRCFSTSNLSPSSHYLFFDCWIFFQGVPVNDGKWHEVSVERHGNSARLTLDRKWEEQGSAAGINDVLNLETDQKGNKIYFGAKVRKTKIHCWECLCFSPLYFGLMYLIYFLW